MTFKLNADRVKANLATRDIKEVASSFVEYVRPFYKSGVNKAVLNSVGNKEIRIEILGIFPELKSIFQEISMLSIEVDDAHYLISRVELDAISHAKLIKKYL